MRSPVETLGNPFKGMGQEIILPYFSDHLAYVIHGVLVGTSRRLPMIGNLVGPGGYCLVRCQHFLREAIQITLRRNEKPSKLMIDRDMGGWKLLDMLMGRI